MQISENFDKFTNAPTDLFSKIIGIMRHSRANIEERFLCTIDKIVDYCLSNEGESINFNAIYLPCSYETSRQLCVRYLIHKSALTFNDELINKARNINRQSINLPEGVRGNSRRCRQIREERRYWRKIVDEFGQVSTNNTSGITLFIVPEGDINAHNDDRNPWLSLLFSNEINNNDGNKVIVISEGLDNVIQGLRTIRENGGTIPTINNIFIFHSRNRRRITNTYDYDTLCGLNSTYHLGIKNCIIFYISEKNFRLYDSLQTRTSLLEGFYHRQLNVNDFKRFISFAPEELNYIFNRDEATISTYEIDDQECLDAFAIIDNVLQDLPNRYVLEHLLSLSINDDIIAVTSSHSDLTGVLELSVFFGYYKNLWDDKIYPEVKKYIQAYQSIAFVVNDWVSDIYREGLKQVFSDAGKAIEVVNYSEFKRGEVSAEYIVFWMFRYTDMRYQSYPNTFDPLPLHHGQKGLVIANKIIHSDLYIYNKQKYYSDLNKFICSNFRCDNIGWSRYIEESEIRSERFTLYIDSNEAYENDYQQHVDNCRIHFEDNRRPCIIPLHSLVLYTSHSNVKVVPIRTLLDEDIDTNIEIQIIDELIDKVRELINKKTQERRGIERAIRSQPEYGLTKEEIESDVELWRYLLKQKVDELGTARVFNDIFQGENGPNSIERWIDFKYDMTLPREIADQKRLLKYLGFPNNSTYYNIVRLKKRTKIKDSRAINSMITALLSSILVLPNELDNSIFNDINNEHSKILELIDINDAPSLNALISLLEVNFNKVKKIERL